jgi:CheY-like chemotaxis protein
MTTRVLVVDDDNTTLGYVGVILRAAGYEVQTANGGLPGVAKASEAPPDLILLDVQMPDLDGFEVCRRLRGDARTRNVPVIMLTASMDRALNRQAYAAGAHACIPKPFRREALIATIESVRLGVGRQKQDGPTEVEGDGR